MKSFLLGTLGVIVAFIIPFGILRFAVFMMDRKERLQKQKQNEDKENTRRKDSE
jgi:large-conductance mechanosensitive channel